MPNRNLSRLQKIEANLIKDGVIDNMSEEKLARMVQQTRRNMARGSKMLGIKLTRKKIDAEHTEHLGRIIEKTDPHHAAMLQREVELMKTLPWPEGVLEV